MVYGALPKSLDNLLSPEERDRARVNPLTRLQPGRAPLIQIAKTPDGKLSTPRLHQEDGL